MGRRKLRSASFGSRKARGRPSSVVRVYERADADGFFWTAAWDLTSSGRPHEERMPAHYTWEQAQQAARALSLKRELEIIQGAEPATPEPVTLSSLWERYMTSAEASDWTSKHRADYERSRLFWTGHLGPDCAIPEALSKAVVEKAARDARKAGGFSARWEKRKLANLRAVVRWGQRKADLYHHNPLDGLTMPSYEPDTDALIYSEEETALLLTPHPDVDWRVTLLCSIAADTGRRLSAMLSLSVEAVEREGNRMSLRFPAWSDKGDRSALVPVSGETAALLGFALAECAVEDSSWLLLAGRLDYDDSRTGHWSKEAAIKALHNAERTLGVPYVPRRAYHGIKRRHVTTAMEVAFGDSSLVGDLTGNRSRALLENVYRKQSRRRLEGHVDAVRKSLTTDRDA